ncbi:Zeatin o-glucosyltransferase [Thalictrum thalictroides]|uniref:Zeatin o-glucosyltransferase n=1 Tax=Thalictrum thalictroides TaxID=46969 RepID=A0A7J6WK06_THATH|nr:Zeatin o-glucosyltransferase [Thalictrum thalictroides]
MESLSMGVPIAAWPMHSDQPRNALLVTDLLKVGLIVRDWECRKNLISSDIIESSIKKLMVSEEGNTMRKKAHELGANIREAISEGGTSVIQLESFLSYISR